MNSTVPIFSPPHIPFANRTSRAAEQEIGGLRHVPFLARKETHVALQTEISKAIRTRVDCSAH
jgi:hypothetical protein